MNAPLDLKLDKATFNRWVTDQEGKFEWKDGRVVQMNNVTRDHGDIVSNIVYVLRERLGAKEFSIIASDFGVERERFVRFPDVLVEPRDSNRKGRRSDAVLLVFEVLSPSSLDVDLIDKPEEYMSLPTLEAYIVVSQDAAITWSWERDPATGRFPIKPVKLSGRDQTLQLVRRGIELPHEAIYENIPTLDD